MAVMPPAPGPQYSPDGKFYWNGQQWVPVDPLRGITPGKAFMGGFFGYFGFACAGCVVALVVMGVLFTTCVGVTHQLTKGMPTPCPSTLACEPTLPATSP